MAIVPGWEVHELDTVASTQDEVRRLLREGSAPPVAVSARIQQAGRGRRGHAWASPPGGLWFSFAISCPVPADPFLGLLVAASALAAVRETLSPEEAAQLALKWPNDLIVSPAALPPLATCWDRC